MSITVDPLKQKHLFNSETNLSMNDSVWHYETFDTLETDVLNTLITNLHNIYV